LFLITISQIQVYQPRTDKLYSETYPPYYAGKRNIKIIGEQTETGKSRKREDYENFFNDRLRKGNNDLSVPDILIGMLERGDKFGLPRKGTPQGLPSVQPDPGMAQDIHGRFLKYRDAC
jgi:hypothetical protein